MEYGQMPQLEKPLSRLVQGTVMLVEDRIDECFSLLDAVFEAGCNTFDTAHGYTSGQAERVLGRWIHSRGIREDVVIITKGAHHNRDRKRVTPFDVTSDLHDSLARLRVDTIDLYFLHRDDPIVPVGPLMEVLNKHYLEGKIQAYGGSNWTAERLAEANRYAEEHGLQPFIASSPNLSIAVQTESPWPDCVSISGPDAAEQRSWYREQHMPLFVWSSLAGGFLTGRYRRDNLDSFDDPTGKRTIRCYATEENFLRLDRAEELAAQKGLTLPQIALSYVLSQPGLDTYAITACWSVEELEENVEASQVNLTAEEVSWIDNGVEAATPR